MDIDKDYLLQEINMVNGKVYDAYDENLSRKRVRIRQITYKYNKTSPKQAKLRQKLINQMFGKCGRDVSIEPTINFDYGCNTEVGDYFFANYNCVILDVAPVKIGNGVMFGPNVTIATPMHPIIGEERAIYSDEKGLHDREYAKPITIEDNVWIASGVTVCGGVTIGAGTVIGAGSVVTKNIPSGVVAAGNPCKVIRQITEKDSLKSIFG